MTIAPLAMDPIASCATWPILSNAARTRLDLLTGQLLFWNGEGNAEGGRRKLSVDNAVGNHHDSEALRVTDRLVPSLAVAHDARKLQSFSYPAPIFPAIQVNRQIHFLILTLGCQLRTSPASASQVLGNTSELTARSRRRKSNGSDNIRKIRYRPSPLICCPRPATNRRHHRLHACTGWNCSMAGKRHLFHARRWIERPRTHQRRSQPQSNLVLGWTAHTIHPRFHSADETPLPGNKRIRIPPSSRTPRDGRERQKPPSPSTAGACHLQRSLVPGRKNSRHQLPAASRGESFSNRRSTDRRRSLPPARRRERRAAAANPKRIYASLVARRKENRLLRGLSTRQMDTPRRKF